MLPDSIFCAPEFFVWRQTAFLHGLSDEFFRWVACFFEEGDHVGFLF